MKKSRLIALTLVVALMLMGTAYAAWTQTINVNSTVSTGELEVSIMDVEGVVAYWGGDAAYSMDEIGTSYTGTIEGDTITFEGTNFFPGMINRGITTVKNTGTIPADINFEVLEDTMPKGKGFVDNVNVTIYDTEGNIKFQMGGMGKSIADLAEITLEKDEVAVLAISFYVNGGPDEETYHEGTTDEYGFKLKLNVSQFNID
jgi:hypothetical protein